MRFRRIVMIQNRLQGGTEAQTTNSNMFPCLILFSRNKSGMLGAVSSHCNLLESGSQRVWLKVYPRLDLVFQFHQTSDFCEVVDTFFEVSGWS